jgi:CheY-like chemotaxis protein
VALRSVLPPTPLITHSPYHRDKLSRLALLFELSECRSLSGIRGSAKGGRGAHFAGTIGATRFIPKGDSGAGLNDMALLFFCPCYVMPSRCVYLRTSPHLAHPLPSVFTMRRLKVLLVDDDDDMRALYGCMLELAGYGVNAVRSGLEAFEEIQVNRPDLIVTDIGMPGFSGLDLIVAVRSNAELAGLPVVAITSFGEKIREQARAAGATDAIDKPTEVAKLREVIDAAVSRPTLADNLTAKTGG